MVLGEEGAEGRRCLRSSAEQAPSSASGRKMHTEQTLGKQLPDFACEVFIFPLIEVKFI